MSFARMFASTFSTVAVSAHDMLSEVSPVDLPGRRMALGPAVLVEAEGEDILDFLGDDLDERAEFIDDLLARCTQEQLDEILAALAEAMRVRALRGDTELGTGRRSRRDRNDRGERGSARLIRLEERAERRRRRRAA
jgi:hypothetical protein